MSPKIKLFLYRFDFIGIVPQFRILKYDSYRSIFSLITSIIITIVFIAFSIYSIIDYLKFNDPSISYLNRYDNALNNTIFIKDILLMFRAYNIYDIDYNLSKYYNDTINLNYERCQIGKNINIKFKDELEKKYNDKINNYYCISSEHGNLPLFSNPEAFKIENYIDIFVLDDENESIEFELIVENDKIAHDNKANPIIASSYSYHENFFNETFSIDYKFDVIKYDNDVGYFFNNFKNFTSLRMSEFSVETLDSPIVSGMISIKQSERYYSHYKMSIISLLIALGKAISNILLQKKMNKDIIRSLLNMNINNEVKEHSLIENNRIKKNYLII